jgi:DNA-directed RNA polymerase sigma subunit (sigma70/sigma32)
MNNKKMYPKLKPHMRIFKRSKSKREPSLRELEMKTLKDSGLSYQKVGEIFGIKRQRVHQILKRLEKA